jgi:hypothetical protein
MENVIIQVVLKKIYKNITVQPLFKTIERQEAEIQGLLRPAEANLGYFLAWFQSLQPSTESERPHAPKPHVF